MAKFNGHKTFLLPKSLKKKLRHLKARLFFATPQTFYAWNRSGFTEKCQVRYTRLGRHANRRVYS